MIATGARWMAVVRREPLASDAVTYGIGGSATQLVYVLFLPIFTRIFRPSAVRMHQDKATSG